MSNSQNNILSNISTILKISCAVIDTIDNSLNENKSSNSEHKDRRKENTRNCKFFNSGMCKYGDRCKFKHSD